MDQKKCSKCQEDKPFDNFYDDKTHKDHKASQCKDCVKIIQRNYRIENKEKHRIQNWKKYGVKNADFHELFETYSKATQCYLCDSEFNNISTKHKKCLGHDHLSGCPRFICCDTCNKKLMAIDNRRMKVLLELHRDFNVKNI